MSINNQTNITSFRLDIPDNGITKSFVLNVQAASIPGISIPVTDAPTGSQGIGRASIAGSTFNFDPLVVRFVIDEDFDSYIDMYKWMLSLNNYLDGDSTGWSKDVLPNSVTLHILDNNNDKIVLSIHYYDAWCSSLSDIEFQYTENSDPAVTCIATLPYKYFQIEKNGVMITARDKMSSRLNKVKG